MQLAINTDFLSGVGSPEPALRAAAEAGFTHLHWCHQWCTDFLYGEAEIAAIRGWLREYNLTLLDIHGSAGVEKCWFSTVEYERQAGVELVANRLEMFAALEGRGSLMMHIPCFQLGISEEQRASVPRRFDALRRSLDELMERAERCRCPIAVENMWIDDWQTIDALLAAYPAERLGICYDSGHANSEGLPQIELLARRKNRLRALHLHDNDGNGDQHQPPFMGTVDWTRLAEILKASSYTGPISFELSIRNTPFMDAALPTAEQKPETVAAFLRDAHARCARFARMVNG